MKQVTKKTLKQRPQDYFFIICFSFFAWSSFCMSSLSALNIPLTADSPNGLIRALHWYDSTIDPLTLINPPSLQVQTLIDTFIFGPFYLLLIYGLIQGLNWLRMPSLLYVSSITYSMVVLLGTELLSATPPSDLTKFLGFNLPYLLIPIAFGWRIRRPNPFSSDPEIIE